MTKFGIDQKSREAALDALIAEPDSVAKEKHLFPLWDAGGLNISLHELDTPGAAAAQTLNSNLTPEVIEKLLALLEDPEYCMNASRALHRCSSSNVRDRAAELAFDLEVDEKVRAWALPLATEYDFDKHRGALWNALLDPSEATSVRGYAELKLRGNLDPHEISELVAQCSKTLEQNDSLNDEQNLQLQLMLGALKGVGTSDVVDLMRSAYSHRAEKTDSFHEVRLNRTELMASQHLADLPGEAKSFLLETILSPRKLSHMTAVAIGRLVAERYANSDDTEVYDALNALRDANRIHVGSGDLPNVAFQHEPLCAAMIAVSPAKQAEVEDLKQELGKQVRASRRDLVMW